MVKGVPTAGKRRQGPPSGSLEEERRCYPTRKVCSFTKDMGEEVATGRREALCAELSEDVFERLCWQRYEIWTGPRAERGEHPGARAGTQAE